MAIYDFVNFELFYDHWWTKFKHKSDPILLFFHYLMVQNEFKVMHSDTEKVSKKDRASIIIESNR